MSDRNTKVGHYIEVGIGGDGTFRFCGFGKLDGITIQLSHDAIHELVPAMMDYLWRHDNISAEHVSPKWQRKLIKNAFRYIQDDIDSRAEEERTWRKAEHYADFLIAHDKDGFEAIRKAISAIKDDSGKPDADKASPALFILLNDFIDKNESALPEEIGDWEKHFLRLALTERVAPDWDIYDQWYEDQEFGDDD